MGRGTTSPLGRRRRALLLTTGLVLTAVLSIGPAGVGVAAGGQQQSNGARFDATPLEPSDLVHGVKSRSGRLAQTDTSLLGLKGTHLVNVMVKLDYDAIAAYRGGLKGLKATSPRVTRLRLAANRPAVRRYVRYIAGLETRALRGITHGIARARLIDAYRVVYGGIAMRVPANQIAKLLRVKGVAAVQRNKLEQPDTSVSPAFVGATDVWPSLGGSVRAGDGVKVGVLDTGVWPEHPSFADRGISHPGGSYGCEFGDGTDPALGAAFTCNDKLIGAYAKTATYMAVIGALPGENCNNVTDKCSARDSDGHGTHTSSTAVGSPVASTPLLGVDRGAISGMAPGAHLIMYRVCLAQGCFGSDSVSAVEQAILDDVDVINFSISGGVNAYSDAVELAFLDAYAAGILVNASAGNNGPGAATANHAGPWTNTVGASTSNRHFFSTLNLTAGDGTSLAVPGVTVTAGIGSTDVVLAQSIPGPHGSLCLTPLPVGSATGKIVACQRGTNARVDKGFNVLQGGAAGMILYNPANQGLNSDNHWLSAIHVEGPNPGLLAFLAKAGVKASWVSGTATPVQGDVMTSFSSRGPLGDFIKPDVTTVGIQVLAGHTPDPYDGNITVGPPGQLFQAIAGTSMSSPHSAGVAALVKDAHPSWTPGQIKSALMTSSVQNVLKEDGSTPATPFDRGAGSIRADKAVSPSVTFDVPSADYFASASNPLGRIHLNLPSINAPTMSGTVETTRTLRNVSGHKLRFRVDTQAPAGATITVKPSRFNVGKHGAKTLRITISGPKLAMGQYFGQIKLVPTGGGGGFLHHGDDDDDDDDRGDHARANQVVLPVAFFKKQGVVTLQHTCAPTTIIRGSSSSCSVTAQNLAETAATTQIEVETSSRNLRLHNVSAPATQIGNRAVWSGVLSAAIPPPVNSLTVPGGSPAGYVPLSLFGVPAQGGVGDETLLNFSVPAFKYGGETYTSIAMTSNGYAVVGGGTADDLDFVPQTFPDTARPNNVLASYWTDLNPETGAAGSGLRAATLTDGVDTWLVLEWENVHVFGTTNPRSFQIWLQLGATEGVWFTYGPQMGPGAADGLNVGAENRSGTSGKNLGAVPAVNSDLRVNMGTPTPGGAVNFTYMAEGRRPGVFDSIANMLSDVTTGVTQEVQTITVN